MRVEEKIISDGQKIAATLLIPDNPGQKKLPGVIFYHGTGSNRQGYTERAQELVKKGVVCLTFDFRGCGESEGEFKKQTINDAINDSLVTLDFLINHTLVDKDRIGVFGRSFGGYLAAVVAGRRKVKSLLMSVPANYCDEDKGRLYSETNSPDSNYLYEKDPSDTEASRSIESFSGNLLIMKHELDKIIPPKVIQDYYDSATKAAKKQLVILEGAGHHYEDLKIEDEFRKIMTGWFLETL